MKKERPQSNGCCCECREKTWQEVVAEHIKDEHEREIIVREIARLRSSNERLEHQNQDLKRFNDGLCLEIARLSQQFKCAEFDNFDIRQEQSRVWYIDYLMADLKSLDKKDEK